jgi:preprotein translocase subunit SecE
LAEHRSPKPVVAGSRPVSPARMIEGKMVKIGKFIGQVKTEMKKVSWPSKDELVGSTIVVIMTTLFLGLFIGICDLILSRLINLLIGGAF